MENIKIYTVDQVSKILGIYKQNIYKDIDAGKIYPVKHVGRRIIIPEIALKDYNNMTQEARNILIKRGYVKETLGTGDSARILSGMIVQKNIKSRFYLNGEYLAIGISNEQRGNGIYYRGYVKEIL